MRFNVHASRRARWGPIAVLLAAVCVFGTAATRSAAHSIIPTLKGVFPLGGGVYAWVYELDLSKNSKVTQESGFGDFFEQADLFYAQYDLTNTLGTITTTPNTSWGIGAATDMASGWSASWLPAPFPVPNAGIPPTITPGIFSQITAFVQWNGSGAIDGGSSGVYLGDYAFKSLSDGTKWKTGAYAARDHYYNFSNLGDPNNNSLQGNNGTTTVPGPVPVSGAHTAVIGLFGSTLFLLRMRKRA